VGAYPGGDAATSLLRTINARQAHGLTGSVVLPSAVAKYAGLELGTERYEEAVWALLVAGALEVDGCLPPEEALGLPFGRTPYRLTPGTLRLLEMA
jgi:hypothetical protein